MKKKGNTLLVVILIIALAVGIGAVGYGVYKLRNRQTYTQKIENGDKYLLAGDYENAVLMYQQAIRLEDQNEQGYLKLANAYYEEGYLTLAIGALENGYDKTKGNRIKEQLAYYQTMEASGRDMGKDPVLNKSLLNKVENTPYGEYVAKNEVESTRTGASGEAIIRVRGISADLIYRNTEKLPAVVIGGEIQENAYPTEVIFDNLTGLLGTSGSLTMAQFYTLEFSDVQLVEAGGTGYQLRLIYLGTTILVPCDQDGNVSTDSSCVVEPELKATSQQEEREEGTIVEGVVEDAQTGYGIAEVTLSFYQGNPSVEEPVKVVTTGDSGDYSVTLEDGDYTVILSKNGYVDVEKDLRVGSYAAQQREDFVLSAESAGEIRIVLEWDSPECDLDSYLEGEGSLMKFSNREITANGETAAVLDRDARSGHGVETTTIYDMEGSYSFFVFDYMLSGELQNSGATVTIYVPGESPVTVSIPSDSGNTWYVCNIDAGKVTVTNYMAEEESSYAPK